MKSSLTKFLWAALGLFLSLFVISLFYVNRSREELDEDSMLMAMLLLAFTGLASLGVGIVLFIMHRRQ